MFDCFFAAIAVFESLQVLPAAAAADVNDGRDDGGGDAAAAADAVAPIDVNVELCQSETDQSFRFVLAKRLATERNSRHPDHSQSREH